MDEELDNTPPLEDLQILFESALPELEAYKAPKRAHRVVTSKRVVELTDIMRDSWAPMVDLIDEELSPARADERKKQLAGLDNRAWIFFSAEMAAEEPGSNLSVVQAAKLAVKVNQHDRKLMGFGKALFGSDPGHARTLRSISRGTGRWDDAKDVNRLVILFRKNWEQVKENPWVTKEYLVTAAADAAKQLDYLRSRKKNKARNLADAAYAMWYFDYTELMKLGRYLARDDDDWRVRFPGVREAFSSGGAVPVAAEEDEDLEDEEEFEDEEELDDEEELEDEEAEDEEAEEDEEDEPEQGGA